MNEAIFFLYGSWQEVEMQGNWKEEVFSFFFFPAVVNVYVFLYVSMFISSCAYVITWPVANQGV